VQTAFSSAHTHIVQIPIMAQTGLHHQDFTERMFELFRAWADAEGTCLASQLSLLLSVCTRLQVLYSSLASRLLVSRPRRRTQRRRQLLLATRLPRSLGLIPASKSSRTKTMI
jgi:hypothetical protein